MLPPASPRRLPAGYAERCSCDAPLRTALRASSASYAIRYITLFAAAELARQNMSCLEAKQRVLPLRCHYHIDMPMPRR